MKKPGSSKASKAKGRVSTQTETRIEADEEKALRMHHGWAAPDDLPLEQVGQENPDLAEKLRAIELRALEMSGRLDELREEAGLEGPDSDPSTKEKIIDRLSDKLSD